MMNTLEINKFLTENRVTSKKYIGCYAADQIPNNTIGKFPHCMVINLDPISSRGSHWVCVYCLSQLQVEYYDSFGIWPPPSYHIQKYLAQFKQIRYSTVTLQSFNSQACGRHVIFFLFNRCLGVPFEKIVKFLHYANVTPDSIVNSFMTKLYK